MSSAPYVALLSAYTYTPTAIEAIEWPTITSTVLTPHLSGKFTRIIYPEYLRGLHRPTESVTDTTERQPSTRAQRRPNTSKQIKR